MLALALTLFLATWPVPVLLLMLHLKIPVVGPFIVPILKRLGLGLADIYTITKGGCVSCNGISVKTVGGGLFIETGKGLNLGTQNSSGNGAAVGIVSGDGLFLGQKLQ